VNDSLLQRWRALAGESADELGEALIAAYDQPHRRYHGQSHVHWLLDEAERCAGQVQEPKLIAYAVWFHDAVYQPGASDNEALSAAWARRALANEPDLAARVAALVEKTKDHAGGEAGADEALFLDMDLSILGASRLDYCAYAAGIRAEYERVPDEAFGAGRVAFLERQLARPRIFRTDLYEARIGQAARANMQWECGALRDCGMAPP